MGIANIINNSTTTSGGEIIRELVNASDGAGLHFDGSAGNIDIASPPDLGTKFSFEFVLKADSWDSYQTIFDFGTGGRFQLYTTNGTQLKIYQTSAHNFTNVSVLGDLKVHHLVLTVDGTSAVLYDNGNQVATTSIESPNIDSCSDARVGSNYAGLGGFFDGTIYRARFWNKTLSSSEVQTAYERADVDYADQYGSQTETSTNSFVNSGFAGFSGNAAGFTTTGSANGNVAYKNQTFTGGKKYRLKFTIADGNSSNLLLLFRSSTGGAGSNVGTIESTNLGSVVSDTYLEVSASGNYELIVSNLGSAQSMRFFTGGDVGAINISAFSIFQIGCVSDYDLAFSNENQSRMVADRSTNNVDGEMSSSGVKQTQVIKQLNSTAMRVGGTSATPLTPADGEIIAGSVTAKTGTTGGITIDASGQTDTTARFELKADRPSADQDSCDIRFYNNNAQPIAVIAAVKGSSANDTDGKLDFYTSNAKRLTIASTGLATFTGGINLGDTTLSNYAEGTWTPTLPNGGTLQTNSGTYTRIGNICHLQFYVSSIAPTADTSQFRIGGLPFTVSDDANYFPAGSVGYAGDGQFANYRIIGNNNTTTCYFHSVAGTSTALSNNDFISQFSGSNDALICSLTYRVK